MVIIRERDRERQRDRETERQRERKYKKRRKMLNTTLFRLINNKKYWEILYFKALYQQHVDFE